MVTAPNHDSTIVVVAQCSASPPPTTPITIDLEGELTVGTVSLEPETFELDLNHPDQLINVTLVVPAGTTVNENPQVVLSGTYTQGLSQGNMGHISADVTLLPYHLFGIETNNYISVINPGETGIKTETGKK